MSIRSVAEQLQNQSPRNDPMNDLATVPHQPILVQRTLTHSENTNRRFTSLSLQNLAHIGSTSGSSRAGQNRTNSKHQTLFGRIRQLWTVESVNVDQVESSDDEISMSGSPSVDILIASAYDRMVMPWSEEVAPELLSEQPPEALTTTEKEMVAGHPKPISHPSEKNVIGRLGTFSGVFVPSFCALVGVVVFVRFGLLVAECGLILSLGLIFTGALAVLLTSLSLSALATNGIIRGGGTYFLISRSLGATLGGATGMLFYFANVCSVTFYLSGLVEGFVIAYGYGDDPIIKNVGVLAKLVPVYWTYRSAYMSICLLFCFVLSISSTSVQARSMVVVFFILIASLGVAAVVLIIQHFNNGTPNNLSNNLWPQFTEQYSWQILFAIIYPGLCGSQSGASQSGLLRRASYSIPRGTIMSIVAAVTMYTVLLIIFATTTSHEILLNKSFFLVEPNLAPVIVMMGLIAGGLSAAVASLTSSAQILQALGQDSLIPALNWILGYKLSNTPLEKVGTKTERRAFIRAIAISWLIAQILALISDLDGLAPAVTIGFLLSDAMINFSCLALIQSSTPSWRPTFTGANTWTALSALALCVTYSFIVDPIYSVCVIAVMYLWTFVARRFKFFGITGAQWGSVWPSLVQANMQRLMAKRGSRRPINHVKHWRPQVLLMLDDALENARLVRVMDTWQSAVSGLLVLGHVVLRRSGATENSYEAYELSETLVERRKALFEAWHDVIDWLEARAFVEIALAPTVREGARNLMMSAGLGGLRPNLVVMGFYEPDRLPHDQPSERERQMFEQLRTLHPILERKPSQQPRRLSEPMAYVGIIRDALRLGLSMAITRGFEKLVMPRQQEKWYKRWFLPKRQSSENANIIPTVYPHEIAEEPEMYDPTDVEAARAEMDSITKGKQIPHRSSQYQKRTIDVWPFKTQFLQHQVSNMNSEQKMAIVKSAMRSYTYALHMAHLMHASDETWRQNTTVRVCIMVDKRDQRKQEERYVKSILTRLRLAEETQVAVYALEDNMDLVPENQEFDTLNMTRQVQVLNGMWLRKCNSENVAIVLGTLPPPPAYHGQSEHISTSSVPSEAVDRDYLVQLDRLTRGVPVPVMLILGVQDTASIAL